MLQKWFSGIACIDGFRGVRHGNDKGNSSLVRRLYSEGRYIKLVPLTSTLGCQISNTPLQSPLTRRLVRELSQSGHDGLFHDFREPVWERRDNLIVDGQPCGLREELLEFEPLALNIEPKVLQFARQPLTGLGNLRHAIGPPSVPVRCASPPRAVLAGWHGQRLPG